MSLYITPNTLSKQAKLLVKHWPFASIKMMQARDCLCKLYGYQNNHAYQKTALAKQMHDSDCMQVNASLILEQYPVLVKTLADLGSMNQIQAKQILHRLWPAYLSEHAPLSEKLYRCQLRFHGSCTDFLHQEESGQWITYSFDDRPSIKDTIEALGVPHPEVGAIQVNGQWMDLHYLLHHNDKIQVYPYPHPQAFLPQKPKHPIFVLDVHLGGLARYLRMAGFDCLHRHEDYTDEVLAEIALREQRILLTRDIGLLKRGNVQHGRWIRNVLPLEQFKEVVFYYQLADFFAPLSRCIRCNGFIHKIEKLTAKDKVPDQVYLLQKDFRQCDTCAQIYWKGSHYNKIQHILTSWSSDPFITAL